MKTITYFSGARAGARPEYEQAARQVGDYIGRKTCLAKYGGSSTGLMGAFCFSLKAAAEESRSGARIIGILPKKYVTVNKPETLGIEYIVTETMVERKHLLLGGSDAFLVMPGGIGTLDEMCETIETDYIPADRDPTLGDYKMRPIFVLNLFGFYDATKAQLEFMKEEKFLIGQKMSNLYFYDTVAEYLAALDRFFRD